MAILPILRWPDARLSMRASAIDGITPAIRHLADDMLETMYAAPGRGLAAPQVGVLQRMFVMDVAWKTGTPAPVVCINPDILWSSAVTATGDEGCLSIPGPITRIARPQAIVMAWTGLDGKRREERLSGFAAICAQHENDHLDGIVTLDRLAARERALALSQMRAQAA
jgi:peptide deformylase